MVVLVTFWWHWLRAMRGQEKPSDGIPYEMQIVWDSSQDAPSQPYALDA